MTKTRLRPTGLRLWLTSIDPGQIRLLTAGRAALALLSIWLVLRTVVVVLTGGANPTIPLFGVLAGMVLLLFIIDLKPSERKLSLWLATVPFAGALILASRLADNFWLNNLILLLLFFSAYFFRRFGPRAGELALVTTVGYYFGFLLQPPPATYPLIVACVFTSALFVYLWQFVFLPYDPAKYLYRSMRAFYHNVARGVAATREALDPEPGQASNTKNLKGQMRQVHRNRGVIEGLFSAAVSPTLWSQPRLGRLQEEMFKTERGLELLVEAAQVLSKQLGEAPEEVLSSLKDGLAALEDQLWEMASGDGHTRLAEAGETLQRRVKSNLDGKPPGEWVYSILRMGIGARELSESVSNIHALEIAWDSAASSKPPITPAKVSTSTTGNPTRKEMVFALHPTTILGLQAVLAAGLAMLAAYLLKLDTPSLVFWTAFVVVAGSTGESLRRITMRVAGVIAGTLIGVALAVILPSNLTLIVLSVTMCIFMSIYFLTVSYIWMVFWLNIGMLLVITTVGGAALELLVNRPLSTLVGGVMAALVVSFVLPIRVRNRFSTALSVFMQAVDQYIEAYVEWLVGDQAGWDLEQEELKIDESYKKLELTLPSVVYEYNPLSRSQSKLASQGTSLAVLKEYATHLKDDVGAEPGSLADSMQVDLIRSLQRQIHASVETLVFRLTQGASEEEQPDTDLPRHPMPQSQLEEYSAEGGPVEAMRQRPFYHLARIHDTIFQIASNLGMPGS